MTSDPDAQRESARTWGRSFLAEAPWHAVADRAALLLTDPPAELEVAASPGFWLIVEREVSRSLPATLAQPLYRGEPVVQHAGEARIEVLTLEAAQRLVEGVSRASMEARWRVRHTEAISDRLRLQERLSGAAAQLPTEVPERVVRTLWLEANAGLAALASRDVTPTLVVAGETRGALERLACFLDGGAYPPARYLEAAATPTPLGQRLRVWLASLGLAVGGDESAARRTAGSVDQVRDEVRTLVRQRVGTPRWLADPDAFWLRAR